MKTDSPEKLTAKSKLLIALGTAFVLYTVTGFFVVPAIVKSQLLKRLPVLTKRQASVNAVKCNPFALSLTIDGLALKESNGDVFCSFEEFRADLSLASLFRKGWVLGDFSLKAPYARVIYLPDGTFNFANLLHNSPAPAAPASAQPAELPALVIHHLSISNGAVAFSDLSRKEPFNTRYQPIDVNFAEFTTVRNGSSEYKISAAGDSGDRFDWSGAITVNPFGSTGHFDLTGLKLNRFKTYSQDYDRFEITDGQVDAGLDYHYDSATNALGLEVSKGSLQLSQLRVKAPDTGEEVANIPNLSIKQIAANLAARTASVSEVESKDGYLLARRNREGIINFIGSLIPQKKPAALATAPPASSVQPWSAKIDDLTLANYTIKVEDQAPAHPEVVNISGLSVNLKNVSNASNAPVKLALNMQLQKTGAVSLNGFVTLAPTSADLVVGVTNVDLRVGQPYLDEQLRMAITRGSLNVHGHAHLALDNPAVPLASFAGDVAVTNFAVTDETQFDELTRWDSLDISGINLALQPDNIQVDRIKFSGSSTSAILQTNHQFNFLTVLPPKPAGASPNAQTAPIPPIHIGEFAFENASLHFLDRTLEPNCAFDIQESSGSLKDISSAKTAPSELSVKGKVDRFSPFSITGRVNPMPDKLFVDLAIAFTNTGLTAFSPYAAKYVGRPLEKGKLSLALHYEIKEKALNASNNVFVDQLTLGAKTDSTNATHLPVKLAVALLKDRNGRIFLDVPVHGRLDDPKFKLWPIIEQVIENMIAKIAASPFTFLGSLFGGGPGMSYVTFEPGQSALSPTEAKKLDSLGKALYARPTLTLEINGSVDLAADRGEIARAKFVRHLKTLYVKDMVAAGKAAVAIEEVKLEPEDYTRLVMEAYTNAFGAYQPAVATRMTNAVATPKAAPFAVTPPQAVNHGKMLPGRPFIHGAQLLLSLASPPRQVAPLPMPAEVAPKTSGRETPAPYVPLQNDFAIMESRLMGKITVNNDDFRRVMEQRAHEVEAYLLKTGKVPGDRLFITDPKPINSLFHGQDRVDMTLD